MITLETSVGRFATKDNSMIFSNIVWMSSENDIRLYHVVDENLNEIEAKVIKKVVA